MNHLNLGKGLSRPYESVYAIARRIIVANPFLGYTDLRERARAAFSEGSHAKNSEYFTNGGSFRKESILAYIVNLNYPSGRVPPYIQLWEKKTTLDLLLWRDLSRKLVTYDKPKRQCTECAKLHYHSTLYDIPWVSMCPIHDQPFVPACEICGCPWPTWRELFDNDCPGCGGYVDPKIFQRHPDWGKNYTFYPLHRLFHLAYSNKPTQNTDRAFALRCHQDSEQFNQSCDFACTEFPRTQCDRLAMPMSELESLGVVIPESFTKTFPLRKVQNPGALASERSHTLYADNNWAGGVRYKTLKRIVTYLQASTNKRHRLAYISLDRWRRARTNQQLAFCPYCLAFSSWFLAVSNDGDRLFGYSDDVTSRSLSLEAFLNLRPKIYDQVVVERNSGCGSGELWFSDTLRRWWYGRELEKFFLRIFQICVAKSWTEPLAPDFEESIISDATHARLYEICNSVAYLYLDEAPFAIKTRYEIESPLQTCPLIKIKNTHAICRNFQNLQYGEEKEESDLVRDNYGLCRQDYVDLELAGIESSIHRVHSYF